MWQLVAAKVLAEGPNHRAVSVHYRLLLVVAVDRAFEACTTECEHTGAKSFDEEVGSEA